MRGASCIFWSVRKRMPKFCTFGRLLGEGSTASVVRGNMGGMEIAVKCTPRRTLLGEGRFVESETSCLKSCAGDHPNVVKLLLVAEDADMVYIGMNLVEGRTPERGVDRGVVAGVIHALEHLRKCHVVHRDVVSHNILVSEAGHPTLVDFGFASHAGRITDPTPPLRSLPPELMYRTDVVAHPAEDLFHLGRLILELHPDDHDAINLGEQLMTDRPELRPAFDGNFQPLKRHPFFDGFDWSSTALGRF
eukprot:Plantae.Rhodophyta-Purpureofilum_apyrenoidigerum.ctg54702.p1 GENE.Plantae.Rhodophyta-Purpureofilum_apyrenoidigerum.ctg54702~~Plantae.Rhodophyta-Purpureofilum_apyrenoidigerum.ctg54702.p1  ORF type:complete len:248 (+),score=22.57 Plantae.Rhodophyta-Purpureofilum_apyrenoidigerum.ctg54702:84-827(+)